MLNEPCVSMCTHVLLDPTCQSKKDPDIFLCDTEVCQKVEELKLQMSVTLEECSYLDRSKYM